MFTIVVLPVVTALVGAMPTVDDAGHYDRLLVGLYVGTMFCNALLLYLMQVELNRHPRLFADGAQPNRVSEAVTLTLTILFGLAGLVAAPQVNLFAMLFLTEPLRTWVFARLTRPPAAES
jgi:hypothetical protein